MALWSMHGLLRYAPNTRFAGLGGFEDNVDPGIIAANAHLFAASKGLAAWFHKCDRMGTAMDFTLQPEQRVLFAQTVRYRVKA